MVRVTDKNFGENYVDCLVKKYEYDEIGDVVY